MKDLTPKKRDYRVVINFSVKSKTVAKGIEFVKEAMKTMGLNVISVKSIHGQRSDNQNNAVHLWFDQIAMEAQRQGLTVDMWIKKPAEMKITKSMLKDSFRAIGKAMYHKDSTAKLSKTEFSEVVFFFDKVVLERLGIDIEFPNLQLLIDRTS